MSIWFEAVVHLNPKHLNPKMNPIEGLKKVFKKHGKDFNEPYAEATMVSEGLSSIRISICNPDGYTETIHKALTEMVDKLAFVQYVQIESHYYS